jgi:hypothetical protein
VQGGAGGGGTSIGQGPPRGRYRLDYGEFMVPLPFGSAPELVGDFGPQFAWPDEPELPWRLDVPVLERHMALTAAGALVPRFAPGTF